MFSCKNVKAPFCSFYKLKQLKVLPKFGVPSMKQYGIQLHIPKVVSNTKTPKASSTSCYQVKKGCEVLVEALEREGVNTVFAGSEDAILKTDIGQAMMSSCSIRKMVSIHSHGCILAAAGYARASGITGVCIAFGGASASDLIIGLADTWSHSIPLVAISCQASGREVQEIPITELAKPITKQSVIVLDPKQIPRIIREAFFLVRSGRPGPVLIEIPANVQQKLVVPFWNQPMRLAEYYFSKFEIDPQSSLLDQIFGVILDSKRPVLYVGGGCLDSSKELTRFVELTGIPVASNLMALGVYPCSNIEFSLQILGNYVERCDLLLAFGVRFNDSVTEFASRSRIVHIDIDPAEIGKIKQPHISMQADIKLVLESLNALLEAKEKRDELKIDFTSWRKELMNHHKLKRQKKSNDHFIPPEFAIEILDELTNGNAIISSGSGNQQILAATYYRFNGPRQLLTSARQLGFGLPTAIGAAISRPDSMVIDLDEDGSFMMNVQELATIRSHNLPVKIMVMNNQHGDKLLQQVKAKKNAEIFPDMLKFARAFGINAARVMKKEHVKDAIQEMLDFPGPYLLHLITPLQPTIPVTPTFGDLILEEHINYLEVRYK